MDTAWVRETELGMRLGVNRRLVRKVRDRYQEGVDWARPPGQEVRWAPDAAERLVNELTSSNGPENGVPVAPQLDEARVLLVAHSGFLNRRVIACVEDEEEMQQRERWVMVAVRDSGKFLPGSPTGRIRARWNGHHWVFAGRADAPADSQPHEPRWRGKW